MTGDKAVELINEWLNLAKEVGDMNLNRMEYDELPKLIYFLKTQEQRGHFFSKAMNKDSQNVSPDVTDLDFYSSKIN